MQPFFRMKKPNPSGANRSSQLIPQQLHETLIHQKIKTGNFQEILAVINKHGKELVNIVGLQKQTPLHDVAKKAHIIKEEEALSIVQTLINVGADVNTQDAEGRTALHWAVLDVRPRIIYALITQGANPNLQDKEGLTPLHLAFKHHTQINQILLNQVLKDSSYDDKYYLKLIHLLAQAKADFNIQDNDGLTPLHWAIQLVKKDNASPREQNHCNEIIHALIKANTDPNIKTKGGLTPLHISVQRNNLEMTQILIEAGINVNLKTIINHTALHEATTAIILATRQADQVNKEALITAKEINHSIIRLLIQAKIDLNVQGEGGYTALHWATAHRRSDLVYILMTHGADIRSANKKTGQIPLHIAARNGDLEIVQIFLSNNSEEAGNLLNIKDNQGKTALHYAIEHHLATDKEVNAKSALHKNAENRAIRVVEALLFDNPNIYEKDNYSRTPLHYAVMRGNNEIVGKMLMKDKTGILHQDLRGKNPFHLAAEKSFHSILETFIHKARFSEDTSLISRMLLGESSSKKTALHYAAIKGNFYITRMLLEKERTLINLTDDKGKTALHWATECNHQDVVNELLSFQPDLELQDQTGCTPMYYATVNEYHSIVDQLSKAGAKTIEVGNALHQAAEKGDENNILNLLHSEKDINLQDPQGHTPLYRAAIGGHPAIVKLLLQKGARASICNLKQQTVLHYCAKTGDEATIKMLLNSRLDPQNKYRVPLNSKDQQGYTPLHYATLEGHLTVVSLLLQAGSEPSTGDEENKTVLHWAAIKGNEKIISLLKLKISRDLANLPDQSSKTPLYYAVMGGHIQIINTLLEAGASILSKDREQKTILHQAILSKKTEVIPYLVRCKRALNGLDKNDYTPLHYTAMYSELQMARQLLEAGALISKKDNIGKIALHWAAEKNCPEMIDLLIKFGADIHTQDNLGRTPLHRAVMQNQEDNIIRLLKKDADPFKKDYSGNTPFPNKTIADNYLHTAGKRPTPPEGVTDDQSSEKDKEYNFRKRQRRI